MTVPFHSGAPFDKSTVPFTPPFSCHTCGHPGYALPVDEIRETLYPEKGMIVSLNAIEQIVPFVACGVGPEVVGMLACVYAPLGPVELPWSVSLPGVLPI